MDTKVMEPNMTLADKCNRYVIGSVLIALVMLNSTFPAWIALVGAYVILTAISAWDPIYELSSFFQQLLKVKEKFTSKILLFS